MRRLSLVLVALLGCATNAGDEPVPARKDAALDTRADGGPETDDAADSVAEADAPLDTTEAAVDTGPEVGPATFVFPATGDTKTVKTEPALWNAGDAIAGSRTTGLAAATSLTGTWDLANNDLSNACGLLGVSVGKVPVDVSLNGTVIGSITIQKSTGLSVPIAFTFPAVSGPTYTLRYEVKTTVTSGCGSIQTAFDVSKLTLE
ncbi:MAG: hypothetical protein IPJ34_02260 [Myxococcales bacterium]|nr:hypothetical protein [Myxococcales bacterium]